MKGFGKIGPSPVPGTGQQLWLYQWDLLQSSSCRVGSDAEKRSGVHKGRERRGLDMLLTLFARSQKMFLMN